MFQMIWREELRVGPEHEALLMVGMEEEREQEQFRARVWIGSIHEPEPILHLSVACESAEAAQMACRRLLRRGMERLGI